jgi:hypothetical protein
LGIHLILITVPDFFSMLTSRKLGTIVGAIFAFVAIILLATQSEIMASSRIVTTSTIPSRASIPDFGRCPIHFFAAGNFSKYDLKNVPEWLKQSDSDCMVHIVRDKDPLLMPLLRDKERAMFPRMLEVPVVLGDFMKLLSLYYFGGVSADFDVLPLKRFPQEWRDGPAATAA